MCSFPTFALLSNFTFIQIPITTGCAFHFPMNILFICPLIIIPNIIFMHFISNNITFTFSYIPQYHVCCLQDFFLTCSICHRIVCQHFTIPHFTLSRFCLSAFHFPTFRFVTIPFSSLNAFLFSLSSFPTFHLQPFPSSNIPFICFHVFNFPVSCFPSIHLSTVTLSYI